MSHNLTLVEERLWCLMMMEEILLVVVMRVVRHDNRLLGKAALVALTEHVRLHVDGRVCHPLLLLVQMLICGRVRAHKASIHRCGTLVDHGRRSWVT